MSLFGTSPDDLPSRPKSSLFDDEPTPAGTSSLFADETSTSADSPWAFPTPKKAARGNLIKTLLPAGDVPDSYIDVYDSLLSSGDKVGGGVSLAGVKRLLSASKLDADNQAKILNIVVPGGQETNLGLGRGEFNVLLALIGLAQEGEDVALDGVDERRRNLPKPFLGSFQSAPPARPQPSETLKTQVTLPTNQSMSGASPPKPRTLRQQSIESPESDPWGSPALHKGHNHTTSNAAAPHANGSGLHNGSTAPSRTTSNFTTSGEQPTSSPVANEPSIRQPASGDGPGWESYVSKPSSFVNPGLDDDGFGGPPSRDEGHHNAPSGTGRPTGASRAATRGIEEVVVITALQEKEGVFMFQHRNYEVASARRNSKVIRRYSDFVWLLDCLHKRYPFRRLPLLPPKRVGINGNHLAADNLFIEKRRRGLSRFANALVRHPVLNQEQLVVMFLTVPTELAVWRKQATISVQEEFVGKSLPPTLEDSLPSTLQDTFDTVRSGVRRSTEIYISLCSLLERLSKRKEGIAADYLRFSLALQSLTEVSGDTYAIDQNDVPLLNEGLTSTSKHLSTSQSLLEDEARAWDEGVLEDLKRQRDCLVSMRDMIDRRDRYAKDNIPQLEKRIQSNENKLAGIRARPEHQIKPGEAEKVEDAIIKRGQDKQSIVNQHARGIFIKECIRDELMYFQQSQYHVSRLHQDWSQERVKYAELQADNWRALSEELEGMPIGE
ncbi:sorting nexin Mvp1 [Cryomyces antarcticus]